MITSTVEKVNKEESCNNSEASSNDSLEEIQKKLRDVISIDIPQCRYRIEQHHLDERASVTSCYDIFSRVSRCLLSTDRCLLTEDERQVEEIFANCRTGYDCVLSLLLENRLSKRSASLIDCWEQTLVSLTWNQTRQVMLDSVPSLQQLISGGANTAILWEALQQVLCTDYRNALVPILTSCLLLSEEEAIFIAQQALWGKDKDLVDTKDYPFLVRTVLIHSKTEQEVLDIALHLHHQLLQNTTIPVEVQFEIGDLIHDFIRQHSVIQTGFNLHLGRLFLDSRHQPTPSWSIPDICAVLSLFDPCSDNCTRLKNENDIVHVLRQVWSAEYINHHLVAFVQALKPFLTLLLDTNSKNKAILLQSCAELLVWIFIMTTPTRNVQRLKIQAEFLDLLEHMFVTFTEMQTWVVDTFLSLSSPTFQMQLESCQKRNKNSYPSIMSISLDVLIFLLQRQNSEQRNSLIEYLQSSHKLQEVTTALMERLLTIATINNHNNINISVIHKISYIISTLMIPSSAEHNNFFFYLQKIFFGSSSQITNQKSIIGILLSAHVLRRMYSSITSISEDVSYILDCICQVIHSNANDDSKIGIYGCYFLCVCGIHAYDHFTKYQQQLNCKKENLQLGKQKLLPTVQDYYNHCKELLASTGLIQLEQTLTTTNNYILGYDPQLSDVRRPMVLCASDLFFTRGNNPIINRNRDLVTYVFRLIDTYLTLGRRCSLNWAPLSWLAMKLQFPECPKHLFGCCNDTTNVWQVWSVGLNDFNFKKSSHHSSPKGAKDATILMQISWIGCISISAILAILHHANEELHNKNISNNNTTLKQLIKFQMARIYSIELVVTKCCCIVDLFSRGRKSKNKKVKENGKNASQSFLSQVEEIQACLRNQKSSFLNISLLCAVLIGDDDDIMLKKYISCPSDVVIIQKLSPGDQTLMHAIFLRISALECLAEAILNVTSTGNTPLFENYNEEDPTTFVPFNAIENNRDKNYLQLQLRANIGCLGSILNFTQQLIPWLCRLRRVQKTDERDAKIQQENHIRLDLATRLAAAHYEVICAILLVGRPPCDELSAANPSLFETFVRASVMKEKADHNGIELSFASCLEHMFNFFSKQLSQCEDGNLATQLIDILTLLTFGLNKAQVTKELIWKAIHTIYSTSLDVYSFHDASRQIAEKRALSAPLLDLFRRKISSFKTLLRHKTDNKAIDAIFNMLEKLLSGSNNRSFRHCYVLQHMVISLWILLPSDEVNKYLRNLFLSLSYFVKAEASKKSFLDSSKRKRRKTLDEDFNEEYILPCLNWPSVSPFFEVLLTTTATSLLFCLPCEDKVLPSKSKKCITPYRDIQNLIALLMDMIDFVIASCKVLSKEVLSSLLRVCTALIKSMEWQLLLCIEWRNTRPLLTIEEEDAGFVDLASVSLLQPLIDSYASFSGKIQAFCDKIRCQAINNGHPKQQEAAVDLDIEGESWIYASFQKAVPSLLLRCEKFLLFLQTTASAHNLCPPIIQEGVVIIGQEHSSEEDKEEAMDDGLKDDNFDDDQSLQKSDLEDTSSMNSESFAAIGWGESDLDDESL